jgi:alanine dehydrogenase
MVVETDEEVYHVEMIVKVKEPQPSEYPLLKQGQILFCYLHLAADFGLTAALVDREVVAIAYETVIDDHGRLPLLTPMSEMAGRISIQAGARALEMERGDRGVLLGGVPGVKPGKVGIIGGGIVGTQDTKMAIGLGAEVAILDRNIERLRQLDESFGESFALYFLPRKILNRLFKKSIY